MVVGDVHEGILTFRHHLCCSVLPLLPVPHPPGCYLGQLPPTLWDTSLLEKSSSPEAATEVALLPPNCCSSTRLPKRLSHEVGPLKELATSPGTRQGAPKCGAPEGAAAATQVVYNTRMWFDLPLLSPGRQRRHPPYGNNQLKCKEFGQTHNSNFCIVAPPRCPWSSDLSLQSQQLTCTWGHGTSKDRASKPS